MRVLFLFILCFRLSVTFAQISLQGIVTDKADSKPVVGCIVLLRDSIGDILKYSITGEKGNYLLDLKGVQKGSYLLEATMLGYAKQTLKTDLSKSVVNFTIEPKTIDLKEVKVVAPKISQKGDTINFKVSSFKESQDQVIGDVLKKIPGIGVEQNGTISYNGKAIDNFYIEGLDLLEGKYGIASENIPADAVSFVQIFENHQDIKALKDKVFSDKVALNIKLKDDVKSKMLWKVEPGIGLKPLLWDTDLTTLYLAQQKQNLSTVKINNIGDNISNELNVFTIQSLKEAIENQSNEPELVSAPQIVSPALSSDRFLFNKSILLSANNLLKLKNDYQLRVNIDYLNDQVKQNNSNYSEYLSAVDSSIVIRESYQAKKRSNSLNMGGTLTANKTDFYLRNSLNLKSKSSEAEIASVSDDWASQKVSAPQHSLENDFAIVKSGTDGIFQVRSFNAYRLSPHELLINPGVHTSVFNQGDAYGYLSQRVKMNSFLSNTSLSLKKNSGNWSREYFGSFLLQAQTDDSKLEKIEEGERTLISAYYVNNLNFVRSQYQLKSTFEYLTEKAKLSIELPFVCNILKIKDRIQAQDQKYRRFAILPRLSINYKIGSYWDIKMRYAYSIVLGDIRDFTQGFILYDYRTIVRNSGILKEQKTQTLSLGLTYRNPVNGMFSGISLMYIPSVSNTIFDTKIEGKLAWRTQAYKHNSRNLWILNGQVSKMLDILPLTLWLDVAINHSNQLQFFQNKLSNYKNLMLQLKPRAHFRFTFWSNINYEAEFSQSRMGIRSPISINFSPISKFYNKFSWVFLPSDKTQIVLDGELLKEKSTYYTSPVLFFADVGFQHQFNQFNLSIKLRNILNAKEYVYSSFDDLSMMSGHYQLRPIELVLKLSFTL